MKKFLFALMAMLVSFSTSTFAGTKTSSPFSIPNNIVIKQTITFNDGNTITVFYQKEGDVCKLYSNTNVMKYKASDLYRVKASNFEIVDHVEGKCLMTKKLGQVIRMGKSLLRQFLG